MKLAKNMAHRCAQRSLPGYEEGHPAANSGHRFPAEVIHTSANSHTGEAASACASSCSLEILELGRGDRPTQLSSVTNVILYRAFDPKIRSCPTSSTR